MKFCAVIMSVKGGLNSIGDRWEIYQRAKVAIE